MSGAAEVLARLDGAGVVPVVTVTRQEEVGPLCDGLVAGGLPVVEITLRTEAGLEGVRQAASRGDVLAGAGTVLDPAQAAAAARAGARFVVSPGLDARVVEAARAGGALPIPGVATATEVQRARALGLSVVKLFPAAPLGGPAMVRALAAPFSGMRFLPTGGVREADLAAYLALPAVIACGGSFVAPRSLIAAGDAAGIAEAAARALAAVARARG